MPDRLATTDLNDDTYHLYDQISFNRYAISVRLASKIPIEECRMAQSPKNDPHQWKYLCIEGKCAFFFALANELLMTLMFLLHGIY